MDFVMKIEHILQVGDYVKTKGARNPNSFRRIVEVKGRHELLVDHYTWRIERTWAPEFFEGDVTAPYKVVSKRYNLTYTLERLPYSSRVGIDKVSYVYNIDEFGVLKDIFRVKRDKDNNVTLVRHGKL